MARLGNDFLRHQQVQAVVDPTAILQQMASYYEAASTPANGFTPTMNVVFPR
jgi:hypothetical protein